MDATSSARPATINRYRLPGIERQGIGQLSLLETALWPLQGGKLPGHSFETTYSYPTAGGRKTATVTVRAPLGLEPIDEYLLWGLLGATLAWKNPDPVLLATPYWMLKHLGLETGGSQYAQLRESLLRLATASYQNTAFYDPLSREHHYAAFQFLSILLPTVGGVGKRVDNDRSWRVEWNQAFFRFVNATGGNLLFDLDLHRELSPAARRLYLKLKHRFWREKRVFLNVDDLTINGLGFAAQRPLKKRKFDLKGCIRELLERKVITLGRGQTDIEDLFIRRSKGCYVVVFYEGPYFRQPVASRVHGQKNAISDDPLYEPLRKIGVDQAAIRRLLTSFARGAVQRWIRITEAAMHEKPRGFPGFRTSPAAFVIDGVQNNRTPPDWFHAHAKRQEKALFEQQRQDVVAEDDQLCRRYEAACNRALKKFLESPQGQRAFDDAYRPYLELFRRTEPHRAEQAAREAAIDRVRRVALQFPEFAEWVLSEPSANPKD